MRAGKKGSAKEGRAKEGGPRQQGPARTNVCGCGTAGTRVNRL